MLTFLGIVFGLPWVLWAVEQVIGVRILFFAAMLSVAVATWVAVRYVWRPVDIAEATALVPVRPIRRTAGYCVLAFVLFIAMSALAVVLNADSLRSLVPFTPFRAFFGMVLGWLRLAAGSIWPAVVGHAVNNTVVFGFVQMVVADKAAEPRIDGGLTGLSGWQGWLIMLVPVAVLAAHASVSGGCRSGPSAVT